MSEQRSGLPALMVRHRDRLLADWQRLLMVSAPLKSGKIREGELRDNADRLLDGILAAVGQGSIDDIQGPEWAPARAILEDLSRSWAVNGFTPSDIAMFVFSLKQPMFTMLREALAKTPGMLTDETWQASLLIDHLGLHCLGHYTTGREEVIRRQQSELLELSTPVVELWHGILALPLIGTLDSERTQTVMESLLQAIVDTGAEIAIIDITGVPTVDTLVAQHLIKTVSAARLMGADCIISGIRPQIAQTIVHLGLELNVVSKATMADAFALALRRTGQMLSSAGTELEPAKPEGCGNGRLDQRAARR